MSDSADDASASRDDGMRLFWAGALSCMLVAALGIAYPSALEQFAQTITSTAFRAVGWFYLGSETAMLVLCLWLAFGRFGDVTLGKPDDEPEFSTASWLAMLFSAGMGSGLLFWGVAEPITHFTHPPIGDPRTVEAAEFSMAATNFHWGLHAWAVYGIAAMVLAYFGFRYDAPNLPGSPIRQTFSGKWVDPVARSADYIAVVAVALGVAAAICMGTMQIHAGLRVAVGVPGESMPITLGILVAVVICYMLSAATSLDEGIKFLSNLNMALVLLVLLFILFAGSTGFILKTFFNSIGAYASELVTMSFRSFPFRDVDGWFQDWTLTTLIWWIAWAPFVGVFIARISRGRTIREFVVGVLLVPTLFSIFWFAVFGGSAFDIELNGTGGVSRLVDGDVTLSLFYVYDQLPMSTLLSGTTCFLVFVFVVTSADSATFVLSMLTSGGSMDPPRRRKLTWGLVLGGIGAALIITGRLGAIRAVAIIGAIPFTLILLLQTSALLRRLYEDETGDDSPPTEPRTEGETHE